MKIFLFRPFIIIPRVTNTLTSQNYMTLLLLKRDKESKSSVKYSTKQHDSYHPLISGIEEPISILLFILRVSHVQNVDKLW